MNNILNRLYRECYQEKPNIDEIRKLIKGLEIEMEEDEFTGVYALRLLRSFASEGEVEYELSPIRYAGGLSKAMHRDSSIEYLGFLTKKYSLDQYEDRYDNYIEQTISDPAYYISKELKAECVQTSDEDLLRNHLYGDSPLFREYLYKIENRHTYAFIKLFKIICEHEMVSFEKEDLIEFLMYLSYNVSSPHYVELYKLILDRFEEMACSKTDNDKARNYLYSFDDDEEVDWRKELLEVLGTEESHSYSCEKDPIKSITCYTLYELILAYEEGKDYHQIFYFADMLQKTPQRIYFYRKKQYDQEEIIKRDNKALLLLSPNDRIFFDFGENALLYIGPYRDMICTSLYNEKNYSEDENFECIDLLKMGLGIKGKELKDACHQVKIVLMKNKITQTLLQTGIVFDNNFVLDSISLEGYYRISDC
ncbi:MAG: hypothetical protein Q4D77_03825 [Peptostreptococcaceae bacterium]|nr:hypothetical protein [Peptostreptococcaceae bacterium]